MELADPVITVGTPSATVLPGGSELLKLISGLEWWALALAILGIVIGAAAWALGSHGQNFNQSVNGRRAVLVSGMAALIIGAAPAVVNWFYATGSSVH
jgi:membrane protein YqaA with SNARE-associated domain